MRAIASAAIAALTCLFMLQAPVTAQSQSYTENGIASTGFNRLYGEPLWYYPSLEAGTAQFGPDVVYLGFRTLGEFDDVLGMGNGNSPPVTGSTPGSALVATHHDANGLEYIGVSPSSVPDSVLNIPLDSNHILVDPYGVIRSPVPCSESSPDPTGVSRAAPCAQPITLDEWLAAEGTLHILCRADGTASAHMTVRNLRPNRMYSVWYIEHALDHTPAAPMIPIPFAGNPNVFVTNAQGKASMKRELHFCPHQEPAALSIAVHLRSNGQNFGGVPVPFLNQEDPNTAFQGYLGQVPGTAINVQLNFNLRGEPAESGPLNE